MSSVSETQKRQTLLWLKCITKEQQATFSDQSSDIQRYEYLSGFLASQSPQPDPIIDSTSKSDKSSQNIREEGNAKYKASQFTEALKLYNKSVAYAVPESQSLALALGNRAACLLAQGHIAEALVDVQRALQITSIDPAYADKLTKRHDVCLNRIIESQPNVESEKAAPKLSSSNEFFESACDNVVLCESEDKGRHLKVKTGVRTGEVLIVEKPYSSALVRETLYTHCFRCHEKSPSLVECSNCVSAMYCSTKCLSDDQEEHSLVCRAVDATVLMDYYKVVDILAVKVLAKALIEDKNFLDDIDGRPLGETYKSSDILRIYHLVGNTDQRAVTDLLKRTFISYLIVKALDSYTPLFKKYSLSELAVGSFILRLLQSLPSNAHEITEPGKAVGELEEVAGGIFATLSLINHSCDPNVVRHGLKGEEVLRAIRPIAAGEEILDNYGFHYAINPRDERQSSLKTQYYFTCECTACTENWPEYAQIPKTYPCFKSLKNQAANFRKRTGEFEAILFAALNDKLTAEMIPRLCEFLDYMDRTVVRPWQDYNNCQEAIKHGFNIFRDFSRK